MAACARHFSLLKQKSSFTVAYFNLKCSTLRRGLQAPPLLRLQQFSSSSQVHSPEKTYGTSKPKRAMPYDVNLGVSENVLLYSDGDRKTFFGLVTIYGIGAFMFLVFIGDSIRVAIKSVSDSIEKPTEETKWYQWWKKIQVSTNTLRNAVFVVCTLAGVLVCLACQFYPLRCIASIWLLQGGKTVSMCTYKPFARIKTFKLPLKEISCETDSASKTNYLHLKLKDKYWFYVVDRKKGKIYNEKLFYASVGLRRKL